MDKSLSIEDAIKAFKALPEKGRDDFFDQLKLERGVKVAFAVAGRSHKRKHRWDSAQGRVVSIRFTDEQYEMVRERAASDKLSVGEYLKWLATRSHTKSKAAT
jgi:hypothetical protein